ncbi:type II toxin-antitoxin system VapC family toxin [bacterium]|nr:type II toxin-antitoxin system VapC family toxin [bacterium]
MLSYILDTHIWLWWTLEPHLLTRKATETISDPRNQIYLSVVSTWEATIKASLGRLSLPGGPRQFVQQSISQDGFTVLPIMPEHSIGIFDLPLLHKDPFDRLLVAQAISERAVLITEDPLIRQYGVATLD